MEHLEQDDQECVRDYCDDLAKTVADVLNVHAKPFNNEDDAANSVYDFVKEEYYDDVWTFMYEILGDDTEVPLQDLFYEMVDIVTELVLTQ